MRKRIASVLLMLALLPFAAGARDWYVYNSAQYGNDANDGATPETPKRTLSSVLTSLADGDTVRLQGTFEVTATIDVSEKKGVTFAGYGSGATVRRSDLAGNIRVFRLAYCPHDFGITGGEIVLTTHWWDVYKLSSGKLEMRLPSEVNRLASLRIENGRGAGGGTYSDGGAVIGGVISNCTFVGCVAQSSAYGGAAAYCDLTDCVFSNCTAYAGGAAAYCDVRRCTFVDCSSTQNGGGVYANDDKDQQTYATEDSTFIRCKCSGSGSGGGAFRGTVRRSTFISCSAVNGGGYASGADGQQNKPGNRLIDCTFRSCSATDCGGGVNRAYEITRCRFETCSAKNNGGGVACVGRGWVTDCDFIGNTAGGRGGGLENFYCCNRCRFFGNTSGSYGSGAHWFRLCANCLFVGNSKTGSGSYSRVACGCENKDSNNSGNNRWLVNCTFFGNTADRTYDWTKNVFYCIDDMPWGDGASEYPSKANALKWGNLYGVTAAAFVNPNVSDPEKGDFHLKSDVANSLIDYQVENVTLPSYMPFFGGDLDGNARCFNRQSGTAPAPFNVASSTLGDLKGLYGSSDNMLNTNTATVVTNLYVDVGCYEWQPCTNTVMTFEIAFDPAGGTASAATKTVIWGRALPTPPTATREGYEFRGWYTAPNGGGERWYDAEGVAQIDAYRNYPGTTLYAFWLKHCTLAFDDGFGHVTTFDMLEMDALPASAAVPVPEVARLTFTGWCDEDGRLYYDASGRLNDLVRLGNDLTLHARWDDAGPALQYAGEITAESAGRTLEGGVYVVPADVALAGSGTAAALTVRENATVVIYVPANVTLTAECAAGFFGIAVPATSTLIFTGEGRVIASGYVYGIGEIGAACEIDVLGALTLTATGGMGGIAGVFRKSAASSVTGGTPAGQIETHAAAEFLIAFDDIFGHVMRKTATLGVRLPEPPIASHASLRFDGWKTAEGTDVYAASGERLLTCCPWPADTTLQAQWKSAAGGDVVFADETTVVTNDLVVDGLTAGHAAPGFLYHVRPDCRLTLLNTTVFGALRQGTADGLGAIYNEGVVLCSNCVFDAVSTGIGWGGAYSDRPGARAVFVNCTFRNCTAAEAGAVAANGSEVTFVNCTFARNRATATGENQTGGAAIMAIDGAKVCLASCTLVGNTAASTNGTGVALHASSLRAFNTALVGNGPWREVGGSDFDLAFDFSEIGDAFVSARVSGDAAATNDWTTGKGTFFRDEATRIVNGVAHTFFEPGTFLRTNGVGLYHDADWTAFAVNAPSDAATLSLEFDQLGDAASCYVGSRGGNILQALIDRTPPGGTCVVPSGTYEGARVRLDDTDLVLVGEPGATIDGGGEGFGLRVEGTNVTVRGFAFVNCVSDNGGAVAAAPDSNAFVERCVFSNCVANIGGAIYGVDTVRSCLFVHNAAVTNGGAVAVSTCQNCTFDENRIGSDWAHGLWESLPGGAGWQVTFVNCLLYRNEMPDTALAEEDDVTAGTGTRAFTTSPFYDVQRGNYHLDPARLGGTDLRAVLNEFAPVKAENWLDLEGDPYVHTLNGADYCYIGCYAAAPWKVNGLLVTGPADTYPDTNMKTSLREAVAFAAAHPESADENGRYVITFSSDMFERTNTVTITLAQTQMDLVAITNGQEIVVQGPTNGNALVINGNAAFRAFRVRRGNALRLENLTFENGFGSAYGLAPMPGFDGGTVLNHGTLVVSNCAFRASSAGWAAGGRLKIPAGEGGAIWNGPTATACVERCTFAGNAATQGGAIYNAGLITVVTSTFADNLVLTTTTHGGRGGGFYQDGSSADSLFANCTFTGNRRNDGTLDDWYTTVGEIKAVNTLADVAAGDWFADLDNGVAVPTEALTNGVRHLWFPLVEGVAADGATVTHDAAWTNVVAMAADGGMTVLRGWADRTGESLAADQLGNAFTQMVQGAVCAFGPRTGEDPRPVPPPPEVNPLQDLINAARAGDEIAVPAGTYASVTVGVDKAGITLVGASPEACVISGGNSNLAVRAFAEGVTLKGLTLKQGGVANVAAVGCVFTNCVSRESGAVAQDATLTACLVTDCQAGSGGSLGAIYNTTARNCTFVNCGGYAARKSVLAASLLWNCDTMSGCTLTNGTRVVTQKDAAFVDPANGDWHVTADFAATNRVTDAAYLAAAKNENWTGPDGLALVETDAKGRVHLALGCYFTAFTLPDPVDPDDPDDPDDPVEPEKNSLQELINAASAGATIHVPAGTYASVTVGVDKAGITLVGASPEACVISGGNTNLAVRAFAQDVEFWGFTFTQGGVTNIAAIGCVFTNITSSASGAAAQGAALRACLVTDCPSGVGAILDCTAENCTFANCGSYAARKSVLSASLLWCSGWTGDCTANLGTRTVTGDETLPVFVDPAAGDWHLNVDFAATNRLTDIDYIFKATFGGWLDPEGNTLVDLASDSLHLAPGCYTCSFENPVEPDPPPPVVNPLQELINAASAGDEIAVPAGAYASVTVGVDKAGITLVGASPEACVISGGNTNLAVRAFAEGVTLKGLTFTQGGVTNVAAVGCVFTNITSSASGAVARNATLTACLVTDCPNGTGALLDCTARNCTFVNCGGYAARKSTLAASLLWNCYETSCTLTNGTRVVTGREANPVFANAASGDWHLNEAFAAQSAVTDTNYVAMALGEKWTGPDGAALALATDAGGWMTLGCYGLARGYTLTKGDGSTQWFATRAEVEAYAAATPWFDYAFDGFAVTRTLNETARPTVTSIAVSDDGATVTLTAGNVKPELWYVVTWSVTPGGSYAPVAASTRQADAKGVLTTPLEVPTHGQARGFYKIVAMEVVK